MKQIEDMSVEDPKVPLLVPTFRDFRRPLINIRLVGIEETNGKGSQR